MHTASGHTLGCIAAGQRLAAPGGMPALGLPIPATLAVCLAPPLIAPRAGLVEHNWLVLTISAPLARCSGSINWFAPFPFARHAG